MTPEQSLSQLHLPHLITAANDPRRHLRRHRPGVVPVTRLDNHSLIHLPVQWIPIAARPW